MGKFNNFLCCFDLTLASRLIGFVGLGMSVCLITILVSDKLSTSYDTSRNTALALGLDWQHFHVNANASHYADPTGELITIIVVFYSALYLITSMLLIFATIALNRWCAVPWLLYELFSCTSKCVAMFYHIIDNCHHLSTTFITGSSCYIVLMIWWWLVVYAAQASWKMKNKFAFYLSFTPRSNISMASRDTFEEDAHGLGGRPRLLQNQTLEVESPVPYQPNIQYSEI